MKPGRPGIRPLKTAYKLRSQVGEGVDHTSNHPATVFVNLFAQPR